jgi:hypothetical protein
MFDLPCRAGMSLLILHIFEVTVFCNLPCQLILFELGVLFLEPIIRGSNYGFPRNGHPWDGDVSPENGVVVDE